ncbi:MAG: DUF262 domain-containing HNH endonuclease family protein [Gemmatimonadales bacterium]
MKPQTVTPDELFRHERRYVIPLFQRGYVWNVEDHWAPLWRDIVVQARRVEEADNGGGQAAGIVRHFLGAIVLEPRPARVKHVADLAVVDGQQRLTTLQVVLVALRDVAAQLEDGHLAKKLALLTENEGDWSSPEEAYKLWPTNVGRSAWRQVVAAHGEDAVRREFPLTKQKVKRKSRYVRQPLAEAYLYFYSQIISYVRGGPGVIVDDDDPSGEHAIAVNVGEQATGAVDANRAHYLLEAIRNYFHIVAIELEPTDDPQVIFESLNGRMAPLTPADLIRNYVFIAGTREGLDTEELYRATWAAFDHDPGTPEDQPGFWRGSQKQGRRTYPRLDLFVFHYVTMRTGNEIAIGRLFHAFRDWWERGPDKPAGIEGRSTAVELARMVQAAGTMKQLLGGSTEVSALGSMGALLGTMDTTTPFPLLLYLAERRSTVGVEAFTRCLDDIASYLIRRALCGLTIKNYNQVFLRALNAVERSTKPLDLALRDYLVTLEGDATRWPADDEVAKGIQTLPAYRSLGPARTQLVLQSLERAHYTGKEEGLTMPHLTVEHVLPQNPSSSVDWPFAGEVETPTLEQTMIRGQLCDSLGNLTLVVQALNSSLSNGPFPTKRQKLADESQLRMNQYFAKFPRDTWREEDIIVRGQKMAKLACEVWRRP